jgi:hypothetical protein
MHLGMRWCGQIFAPMLVSPCGSNTRVAAARHKNDKNDVELPIYRF